MQTPRILPKKKQLTPRKLRRKQFGPKITYIKSKYTETRIMNQFHLYYRLLFMSVYRVPYVTSQVKVTDDITD